MARKLKWEAAAWSIDSGAARFLTSTPFAGGRAFVELVSAAAVEASTNDGIWVERIVGQVFHRTDAGASPAPPYTNIKERVAVGHRFGTVVGTNDVSLPWDATHAGVDNFLWERTQTAYEPSDGPPTTFSAFVDPHAHPWFSVVDIRVGRMLRPTQFLAYMVQTDPALVSAGSVVLTHGWLRVLISE